jgi:catechol 2,3-dioxygenase-like lactoylglutathione lyase family enzyme
MPTYKFHHVHLLSRDPKATAQYYRKIFDAKIIESVQSDGKPRIDMDMHGLPIFILAVPPGDNIPSSPPGPYLGLDHFGLLVDNLDEAAAELKRRGAEFSMEPRTARPGVKIAYVRGPENVRIELVERA